MKHINTVLHELLNHFLRCRYEQAASCATKATAALYGSVGFVKGTVVWSLNDWGGYFPTLIFPGPWKVLHTV